MVHLGEGGVLGDQQAVHPPQIGDVAHQHQDTTEGVLLDQRQAANHDVVPVALDLLGVG